MEQIKSCEKDVVMVPNEENSSNVIVSNPERIETETTSGCLVQRRISSRIPNPPIRYGHCDIEKKRETNDRVNYSIEKRTKLNNSRQHKKCVTWSTSSSKRSDLLVFDELDFRGILSLKQTLRLANLYRLAEEEQNRHNVVGNNRDKAEISRNTEANKNWIDDTCTLGLAVSKHLIERLQTLARLGIEKVHFAQGQVSRSLSVSPSLVCRDISEGQEAIKVIVTNEFDDPPVAPAGFTYITSHRIATNLEISSTSTQCDCKGSCKDVKTCRCASLNGSEFPYTHLNGGRLIESRDIVFECGPRCGCGPKCGNRVSQKPLKYQLEVYRTAKKGWAVRTWDFIPSGAPVVEYIGVLNRCDEIDNADLMNEYIFDIDCLQTINGVEGREKRKHKVSLPSDIFVKKQGQKTVKNGPEFCIDASKFGNVSRFINHGCEPNLFVQCVLSSYHDIRLARVVLFAAHDIHPNLELTYDYGYALDSVVGPDGQIKQLPCHCGAATCRRRLY